MSGKTVHRIHIREAVVPHIKVIRKKGKKLEEDGESENGDAHLSSRKRRKQAKKAKKDAGKNSPAPNSPTADAEDQSSEMLMNETICIEATGEEKNDADGATPVLAVQKIVTASFDGSELLLFSVHGYGNAFRGQIPSGLI